VRAPFVAARSSAVTPLLDVTYTESALPALSMKAFSPDDTPDPHLLVVLRVAMRQLAANGGRIGSACLDIACGCLSGDRRS
jgi:hypothetical protein